MRDAAGCSCRRRACERSYQLLQRGRVCCCRGCATTIVALERAWTVARLAPSKGSLNHANPSGAPNGSGGGYFVLKNSWGENAADCGYYYVPYDYVLDYARSLTAIDVN